MKSYAYYQENEMVREAGLAMGLGNHTKYEKNQKVLIAEIGGAQFFYEVQANNEKAIVMKESGCDARIIAPSVPRFSGNEVPENTYIKTGKETWDKPPLECVNLPVSYSDACQIAEAKLVRLGDSVKVSIESESIESEDEDNTPYFKGDELVF
jgi:hypothetical protein